MKKTQLILLIPIMLMVTLFTTADYALAINTDKLYSEMDDNGDIIDGNETAIKFDQPLIRPSYVGSSILDDVIGPDGRFEGFWGEQPDPELEADSYWGHQYSIANSTIIKNVGYYKAKSLALKISYTQAKKNPLKRVTLTRDGGLNLSPDSSGIEFRLVYDDGKFNTPVEGVYVELPVLSQPTAYNAAYNTYSSTNIKRSNLIRLVYNEEAPKLIENKVTRKEYTFKDSVAAKDYKADSLIVTHMFESDIQRKRNIRQTFIFDNKEPLVIAEVRATNMWNITTLFKSSMKAPGEISYLPPRTNGSQNTMKFEANFDLTQAINDGYEQFFPESLSLVMLDDEKMFNSIRTSNVNFKDQNGKDISNYFTKIDVDDHQVEFRIMKKDLITLGSNQINAIISAENLNPDAVTAPDRYDAYENVYRVPVKFYNFKVFKGVKTSSDKMTAIAKITPNIYGEAVEGATALQYTKSGDLNAESLVKNVASTIPEKNKVAIDIYDKQILFKEAKKYIVEVKISVIGTTNYIIVDVPIDVKPQIPITREDFDSQEWLISEIEKQTGKQMVGTDYSKRIFETDLLKIISISDPDIPNSGERIPKGIGLLKNLEILKVTNKPNQLTGSLPIELGHLKQLTNLSISGHSFSGGIPVTLTSLNKLNTLNLSNNQLTGTIPTGFETLTNLRVVSLNNNRLVGSLSEFKLGPYTTFNVSNTQLTYNSKTAPSFIKDASNYQKTFIASKTSSILKATDVLPNTQVEMKIKPFDSNDIGYFNLHVLTSENKKEELYSGHTFKIINKNSGVTLYNGEGLQSVIISIYPDETYSVIMDGASNNPNNIVDIETVNREYRIDSFPKDFTLDLEIGDLSAKELTISSKDNLTIFDNRLDSKWELKVKPSALKSQTKTLVGSYQYKTKNGKVINIPNSNTFKTIESGNSEPSSGTITISNKWDNNNGLFYKQLVTSNYKDSYTGNIEWQLLDVP